MERLLELTRQIVEAAPVLIYIYDVQSQCNEYVSPQISSLLGYSVEEVSAFGGELISALLHPDDMPQVSQRYANLLQDPTEALHELEYRMRHKAGHWVWLLSRDRVIKRDDAGQPLKILGVAVDITERKHAAEAQRISEARFRAVQETSIDGFMVLESVRDATGAIADFRWVYANEAAGRIVGRPHTWFAGELLLETMPGNREDGLFDAYVGVVETGRPWTSEFEYKHEGLDVYIRLVAAKAGDGFAVTFSDLSERRRAEMRIAESERRFRDLANAMPQIVWTNESDGRVSYLNQRWLEYTGLSLEDSLRDANEPMHPDDRAPAEAAWASKASGHEPFEYEMRLRRHDGEYRWFLARCVPAFNPEGQLSGWYGTSTDIHDRKLMEDALRANEAQFRTLSESLPDMLWIADGQGLPIYQNPAWRAFTGLTSHDLATQGFSSMHHPADTEQASRVWEEANQRGEAFELEMRMRRHDGQYRWCNGRTAPIKDHDGNIIRWIGTITDVHDRKLASHNTQFLADLGKHLSTVIDPHELMWQVVDATAQHFGVPRAGFALFDAESGRITITRDYHAGVTSLAGSYPQWWLPAEYVNQLHAGTPVVIHDLRTDERTANLYPATIAWTEVRSGVAVPLLRHGRCVAVLFIADNAPGRWEETDIDLLRMVAERAWLAIESNRVLLDTQMLNAILETRIAERTESLEQSHEQLRQLTSHVAQAREEERARIAREVHDQLGGALTVVKMSLAQITRRITVDEDTARRLDDFRNQIDELVQTARRISYDLRPSMLDDFGLFAAIEWQAHEWERRTGIACELDLAGQEVQLNSARRTAVFRAFQEALTNVARHAQATLVSVSAQQVDHHLLLTVRDNGCGIRTDSMHSRTSMGLLGMRERLREVAGDVEISGKAGEGTIVTFRVPLQA